MPDGEIRKGRNEPRPAEGIWESMEKSVYKLPVINIVSRLLACALFVSAAVVVSSAAAMPVRAESAVIRAGSGETVPPSGPASAASDLSAEDTSGVMIGVGPGAASRAISFDVSRFSLPENAEALVVVEGSGGSTCRVYAYTAGEDGWVETLRTSGYLGLNGMSSDRTEGDKTTPIGLFCMNTPFGQCEALEGFPESYIQVTEDYVWSDATNMLVADADAQGEHVGTHWYAGYYDYAIDMGYNREAIAGKGSALFLHCIREGRVDTSGCVAIPREDMIAVMKLYGACAEGACYIALAPEGGFEAVYDSCDM